MNYLFSFHSIQLLLEAGFPDLVEEAMDYICQRAEKPLAPQQQPVTPKTDHAAVVFQTVEDLISISADQPVPKVS